MAKLSHRARFWLLTAAAVVVAGTTFSLGQWQLRRAAQKQALMAAIEAQANKPILKAADLPDFKNLNDAIHRQATLKGVWRAEHTIYLDNRQMNGLPGLFVITPLTLDGTGQVILVQRGWVARNFTDRNALPVMQTPTGPVTVRGLIAPPPSKLYAFKGPDVGRIRQNIDVSSFSGEISTPLLPVSMVQTGPANEGLQRSWSAPNAGVDKHYGYAFQWFGLCALVVGLYAWFQVIQPLRAKRKQVLN